MILQEEKKFKNQQNNIKISVQSKKEPGPLIKLTNRKYTHELISLLINHYVENELALEQKRKFELLAINIEISLFLNRDISIFWVYFKTGKINNYIKKSPISRTLFNTNF
ncbi:hypothetical protein BAQ49_11365 [Bacillus proteolyticus]|uniref:Uncharacterized protein n=1 Tax=Bacillus proteolyticus TaxID=2026192 RepID=A0AA44KUC6_9BACI|nr:hypothetical protein BAQ49_11365 [Bacillus proteolyticus]